MITKIGNWFSKLVKKSPSKEEDLPPELNDIVAFFNITINSDNEAVFASDFLEGNEEAMAKLVFMLCSGALMDVVANIVAQRCKDNEESRDKILSDAYNMILENVSNTMTESEKLIDDENPLVDPCFVFRDREDKNDIINE